MYCHWSTISLEHPYLLVVPFRLLPSEMSGSSDAHAVNAERTYIRDFILHRTRDELMRDPIARALMRELGSDLVVNAYACNFKVSDEVNADISEANALNRRISEKLCFHKLDDNLHDRKVILMCTTFRQKEYGACLMNFKRRLGLEGDSDLFVLVNVSMSPFASPSPEYERMLANEFLKVAEEEAKVSRPHHCQVATVSKMLHRYLSSEIARALHAMRSYFRALRHYISCTYHASATPVNAINAF